MGTVRRPPSSLGGQKPLTITERERDHWEGSIQNIMNFDHGITYVAIYLDTLTCLFLHTRLLKAHTKLLEAHKGYWRLIPGY